ncbi:MAG: TetR family transcriptional regulator C-terminal domain-containing protein [Myxococcota bacterium]
MTKREKEVVLELLDGGRVGTIAKLFGVSPRTVSNHLKAAYWKLGVHSQAELIEQARSDPARLGLDEAMNSRSKLALEDLEERCARAVGRLTARIEKAYDGPSSLSQLRAAVRTALPLDPERRREWRDWLEFRSRSQEEVGTGPVSQTVIDAWRDSNGEQVRRLQRAGAVRAGLDSLAILRSIGAIAVGAGTRILGDASPGSIERELQMIDDFIDSLMTSDPHR